MSIGEYFFRGTDRRGSLDNACVPCLAGPVLAEQHGQPGVEGDLVSVGECIDALDFRESCECEGLLFVCVAIGSVDRRNLGDFCLSDEPLLGLEKLVEGFDRGLWHGSRGDKHLLHEATNPRILLVRPVDEHLLRIQGIARCRLLGERGHDSLTPTRPC